MPEDLYISHICFYALRPEFCHKHHLSEGKMDCTKAAAAATSAGRLILQADAFKPTNVMSGVCATKARLAASESRKAEAGEEELELNSFVTTVPLNKTGESLRDLKHIQKKKLFDVITSGQKPQQRLGLYHTRDAGEIAEFMQVEKEQAAKHHGVFALEVPFDKGMEYRLDMEEKARLEGRRGSCKAEPPPEERKHTVARTMMGSVATPEFTKEPVRSLVGTPGQPKAPPGEAKSKQALKRQARKERQTGEEQADEKKKIW